MTPKKMLEFAINELVKAGPEWWIKKQYWKTDENKFSFYNAKTAKGKVKCCLVGRTALMIHPEMSVREIEALLTKALNKRPIEVNDNASNFNELVDELKSHL